MRFGLYAINYGTCADPDVAGASGAARRGRPGSTRCGPASTSSCPSPQPPDYAIAPEIPFLDAVVALALAAAHTTSITVGTGILELPLHQPVLLAKQLASVDQISRGRLVVGVGVGYLALEFAALGVPLDERATRTDEHLEAMRALWTMDAPEFHGRHVDFAGVDAHPRPVQPGGPPIMIGGNSALARRRAITSARGWIPADFDLDATRDARRALDEDLDRLERPASLGPFDFTVISPKNRLDRELVDGYRELGRRPSDRAPRPRRADAPALPRGADRRHLPDHRPPRRAGARLSGPGLSRQRGRWR